MANKVSIALSLPPGLKRDLAELAEREHRSISSLVEVLLLPLVAAELDPKTPGG